MGALVEWVLGVRGALPVLLLLLLGLGFGLDLWGAFEADFCPGPSIGVAWPLSSAIRLEAGINSLRLRHIYL